MLDCFRTGGANSGEVFIAGMANVLSKYPASVIEAVTDPGSGIPVKQNWQPSLKEVRDACEAEMEPIRRRERQQKIVAETLAERDIDKSDRPTREDLKAKYGENWGLKSLDEPAKKTARPAPSWEQIAEHYQARPGRIQWLADRLAVLRGDAPDTPEPN
jgi:hypothetical protein